MPAGHPFQGGQPRHLETSASKSFNLPKRPFLSSNQQQAAIEKEDIDFDTDKMMRYDDFTDENVGNIIMDQEPLPPQRPQPIIEREETLRDTLENAQKHEGIEEFDEIPYFRNTKASYEASGNRPLLAAARGRPGYRPYQRGPPRIIGGRNHQGSPLVGLKRIRGKPRPGPFNTNRPQRHIRQRPLFKQQRQFPKRRPQPPRPQIPHKPQVTLRDTFDYDDTDVTLPVEFDDIGYNDDEYIENFENPLTKQEMDALYKVYKQIRLQQMQNQTSDFKEDPNILFYTVERVNDSDKFTKRALDIGSAVGLLTFLYSQLDVVTALSVVANLEKRAQYDPQFRTSFPTFLRQNSWFLPPKKYKIVPHTRPLRSPAVGPNVLGVVQFNGGNAGGHGHPRARPPRRPVLPGPKPPQFTEHFEENYDDELPYVTPLDDADFNGGHRGGDHGFFSKPNNFPTLQELSGGGFRQRNFDYDDAESSLFPENNRRRRRRLYS